MDSKYSDILAERLKRESEVRLAALREVRELCLKYRERDTTNWGIDEVRKQIDSLIAKEEK